MLATDCEEHYGHRLRVARVAPVLPWCCSTATRTTCGASSQGCAAATRARCPTLVLWGERDRHFPPVHARGLTALRSSEGGERPSLELVQRPARLAEPEERSCRSFRRATRH